MRENFNSTAESVKSQGEEILLFCCHLVPFQKIVLNQLSFCGFTSKGFIVQWSVKLASGQ